jgi:hypothetical protein
MHELIADDSVGLVVGKVLGRKDECTENGNALDSEEKHLLLAPTSDNILLSGSTNRSVYSAEPFVKPKPRTPCRAEVAVIMITGREMGFGKSREEGDRQPPNPRSSSALIRGVLM